MGIGHRRVLQAYLIEPVESRKSNALALTAISHRFEIIADTFVFDADTRHIETFSPYGPWAAAEKCTAANYLISDRTSNFNNHIRHQVDSEKVQTHQQIMACNDSL